MPQAAISIREINADEWKIYSALRLEALQDSPRSFGGRYEIESCYSPQEWQNWLLPRRQGIFVMFDESNPIGLTGILTREDDKSVGELIASYLKPEYRGRGLSKLFFDIRFERALEIGAWKRLRTCHREGNEASRQAIVASGFKLHASPIAEWPDGSMDKRYDYFLDIEDLRRRKMTSQQTTQLLTAEIK